MQNKILEEKSEIKKSTMQVVYSSAKYTTLAQQSWDAIVIGSGVGGLTTALMLAQSGKRVLVLEKHVAPGGLTHTFRRKGFEWDVGVHYVGKVGNLNTIFRKAFDFYSRNQLKWAPIEPIHDRVIIAGDVYDFVSGRHKQIEQLSQHFPHEKKAIKKYFKLVRSVYRSTFWYWMEKTLPNWASLLFGKLLRFRYEGYARKTTYEVLSSFIKDERLISVLSTPFSLYGLPPRKSSFALHALVTEHYIDGVAYPAGGAKEIHKTMISNFIDHGGTLVVKAPVEEILITNGQATGVRLQDGNCLYAKTIISNAGARNTFKKLLAPQYPLPTQLDTELGQIKASIGHVCLYVGLSASDDELNLPKHNFWIYDSYDFDKQYDEWLKKPTQPLGVTFITAQSAKDPRWAQKHPGKAVVQVAQPCLFERFKEWDDKPWMRRGEDYLSYKHQIKEDLLRKLYEALPQTIGKVTFCEVSTPLSTRHFTGYQEGEVYGLEHSPNRALAKWLRPRTPIPGLYLTGQDVTLVGVIPAMVAGTLAATTINGRSLAKGRLSYNKSSNSQSLEGR